MAAVAAIAALFALPLLLCRLAAASRRRPQTVGFFHPYCNDGGGGERVLWCAVAALQRRDANVRIVVFTGDALGDSGILENARERFGIELPRPIEFVRLRHRWLIDASTHPRCTMLGQALGGALLALEALARCCPAVFVDTMGAAFGYPVARGLFGCHVACYVHYPTISTEMLGAVAHRRAAHNNSERIARSAWRTALKLGYYSALAVLYAIAGRFAHVVLVNSSWTAGHIRALWRRTVEVVYPPCDTAALRSLPLASDRREPLIVSIAQFRPEKDHALQLRAFARMRALWPAEHAGATLVVMGACRNADDARRAHALRELAVELGVQASVRVLTDVSYAERLAWMARAACGVHTMWMEHFGIGVVELMAAGIVPVAHSSGGPLADIVVPVEGEPSGLLAADADEYAHAMHDVLACAARRDGSFGAWQERARAAAARFSDERFAEAFTRALAPVL